MKKSLTFFLIILFFLIRKDFPFWDYYHYKPKFDFPEIKYELYPIIPYIHSPSYLVAEIQNQRILLCKNEKEVRPIASITKLITAIVVLESKLSLNEILEITEKDVDTIKGSSSHLINGVKFERKELLNLALMSSENRAALSLARNHRGGIHFFIKEMNAFCQSIGANDSYFVDPTGLSPYNVSTALDLLKIGTIAYTYDEIRNLSTSNEVMFESKGKNFRRTFYNTNSFITDERLNVKMSKTGYILESQRCIIMVLEINKKDYMIILLGTDSIEKRNEDIRNIYKFLSEVLREN